jgi:hypothetical protein
MHIEQQYRQVMKNETATAMNMLLEDIQKASGVDQVKAELALGAMLGFFGARLPSPVMGRIREALLNGTETDDLGNARE